jgi:hypothetical protein
LVVVDEVPGDIAFTIMEVGPRDDRQVPFVTVANAAGGRRDTESRLLVFDVRVLLVVLVESILADRDPAPDWD